MICAVIVCLGVLEIIGALPYLVARISSSVYITANYPAMNLEFSRAGSLYGFGDYGVEYKDKDGNNGPGLQMYPKEFPVFVRYDSLKGHA